MGRLMIILVLLLGGACPVQLPSSLLILSSTQRSPDSYLISCTNQVPEERVTQVHWKERHTDGTYSIIAVQNPHWGNSTQLPYQEIVKLNQMDDTTYTMEITVLDKVVCCEVVTYPSGKVHERCLNVEGESDDYNEVKHAVLGISLVTGFFMLGSFVLLLRICWMKKSTRRVLTSSPPVWRRSQRSHVPYRRTPPSINLAFEPPLTNFLHTEASPPMTLPRETSPRNQLPPEDLLPRNPQHHVASQLRNQWPSESPSPVPPTPQFVPSLPSHVIAEVPPPSSQIYSNVHRLNKPYRKTPQLKILQHESTMNQHYHSEAFHYAVSNQSSPIPVNQPMASPWLCAEPCSSSEVITPLQTPRLHSPSTPVSLFSTVNPMYHSGTGWAAHSSCM